MFTGPELSLFHDPYFSIIRLNDELCQLRSRNTGHCWMIWKNYNADPFRIELHHKHHLQDKYYHQQRRQVCSVRNAIRIIKEMREKTTRGIYYEIIINCNSMLQFISIYEKLY